jgi:WD40 repeat protein
MSPEQAEGRVDQLGPESDVYSLGATLYCLLTGQAPITDRDSEIALRKIREGDIPRPRTIVSRIPPALEAVCLKAMAVSPGDRYRTPGELAREIESWLADEPISVYQDSPSERAARWTRRHRGWAQAGSLALLLVAVISVIAAFQVDQARQRSAKSAKDTTIAMGKLAIEKQRADDERDLAIQRGQEIDRITSIGLRQTYNAQLTRVRELWGNNPGIALRLIDDADGCPADLRDFTWGYYYRLLKQERSRLTGHTHAIEALAVSPDGQTVASGDSAGVIKLWDARFDTLLETITDHIGPIEDIEFSPNGMWLASTDVNKNVKLRDAVTADVIAAFTVDAGSTLCLAFSPDSSLLAIGSYNKKISLWETTTKEIGKEWEAHETAVEAVAFSPDGEALATAGRDGIVQLWNVETAQLTQSFRHGSTLQSVAFRPDGTILASTGSGGTIKLWDPTTGQLLASLTGHTRVVRSLAFSSDGSRLASASIDDSIRLWDVEAKSTLTELRGHLSGVNAVAFALHDRVLVSASHDRTIRLWELTQQERRPSQAIEGHRYPVSTMALSRDGKTLATAGGVFTASGDNELLLWDLEEARVRASLVGHTDYIHDIKFSPDGSILASASRDKTIKLWDAQTGNLLRTIGGHAEWVLSLAFSPDGTRLASGSGRYFVAGVPFKVTERIQAELKLWNPSNGEELASFSGPFKSTVDQLAFSPDGSLLTSDSRNTSILLWNSSTGDLLDALQGSHQRPIASVAFAPNGQTLVTGDLDGRMVHWDLASRSHSNTLQVLSAVPIDSAAYSADGKSFATGSRDGTIQFWDPVTTQFRSEIQAHSGSLKSVLVSPDSRLVISAGTDKEGAAELKLWRAEFP